MGIDREVTIGAHQSKPAAVITRYFTEKEMEAKKSALLNQGKTVSFVPPFASQQIPKEAVRSLLDMKDDLIDLIMRVHGGEELDEDEALIQLHNELYMKLDCDSSIVHIRKFWFSTSEKKMMPHKRGVTITLDECLNILEVVDNVLENIE